MTPVKKRRVRGWLRRAVKPFRRFISWWGARLTRDRFDPAAGAEFYELLRTTFEPGAMLLAAATAPDQRVPPPPADGGGAAASGGGSSDAKKLRSRVRPELEKGESLDPRVLIDYVEAVEDKSPRVVYNLACYYAIAAAKAQGHDRGEYVRCACERLRQSISRTPPLERRGLLTRAEQDPDLAVLHEEEPPPFEDLWKLVPAAPSTPTPPGA
jgi:hypothetical protein